MSFLESIQHGLERASQEASRITKIQHLHNVANDLNFKASQEGQTLIAKAMEMYYQGLLAQGELTAICQEIATYQQHLNEVHEELQRLQNDAPAEIPQPPLPAQAYPPGQAYPPYPMPPADYTPYPASAPQAGYPYPAPAGYTPYPAAPAAPYSSSGEPPTQPGSTVQESEPPTQPGATNAPPPELAQPASAPPESAQPASAQPKTTPHKPHHHTAAHKDKEKAEPVESATPETPASAPAAGTYANGTLPPIYSPFSANSAGEPAAPATPAEEKAEPEKAEKPARAHHKKAAENAADAPAAEK